MCQQWALARHGSISYCCLEQTRFIYCACYDREARKQKDEDILNDKAKGGDFSTTGTLLDPYGKEPSKYPTKSS